MTGKLLILVSLMSGFFALRMKGQENGAATLNVNLFPVQTIEVNGEGGSVVELAYQTKEDYKNGVSVTKENHLKVYSTGGFVITVKSLTPTLTSTLNNGVSIAVGDIAVTASPGTTNSMQGFVVNPVQLSIIDTAVISSNFGGNNLTFTITYSSKGDQDAYLNKFFIGQNPTVYTTQIIYSIEPQ